MADSNGNTTTVEGIVAVSNEKGVRLQGRDEWANYSKWGEQPTVAPSKGDRVSLQLDKKGFIRRLDLVGGTATMPDNPPASDLPPAESDWQTPPSPVTFKDRLIVRQVAIKAASAFCSSRPDLKSSDLLALAERLEAWCLR